MHAGAARARTGALAVPGSSRRPLGTRPRAPSLAMPGKEDARACVGASTPCAPKARARVERSSVGDLGGLREPDPAPHHSSEYFRSDNQ